MRRTRTPYGRFLSLILSSSRARNRTTDASGKPRLATGYVRYRPPGTYRAPTSVAPPLAQDHHRLSPPQHQRQRQAHQRRHCVRMGIGGLHNLSGNTSSEWQARIPVRTHPCHASPSQQFHNYIDIARRSAPEKKSWTPFFSNPRARFCHARANPL